MKKFNKSEIFKRMWQLVKEAKLSRSAALSRAWAEAKAIVELPELTGTEKQVAWASDIRVNAINHCNSYIADYARYNRGNEKQIKAWTEVKNQLIKGFNDARCNTQFLIKNHFAFSLKALETKANILIAKMA